MPASNVPFSELASQLDYSMLIVTTKVDGDRGGCLVGFASQVSIHPPRFLVCISDKNRTFRLAKRARVLIVHFVPEDARDLAELFGGETGDEIDKFERVQWHPGPDGAPVLDALGNWFAGRILERLPFGDHCGFLLEPIGGAAGRGESTLTFHRAKWIEPGHEP